MALLLHAVYVYMRRNDRSQQTSYSKETELYRILFERSFSERFNFQHCCICYVFAADKRKYLLILKSLSSIGIQAFFIVDEKNVDSDNCRDIFCLNLKAEYQNMLD